MKAFSILKYAFLSLVVCVVGLVAIFVGYVSCESSKVETGAHLARVDWLPETASDITFKRTGGFGWCLVYECTLPEDAFQMLAQKEGWKIQETTNVSAQEIIYNRDLL